MAIQPCSRIPDGSTIESFHDQVLGIRQLFTRATPPEPGLNVEDLFDLKSFLSSCPGQDQEFVVKSKRSSTFRFFTPLRALHFPFSRRLPPPKSAAKRLKQTINHEGFSASLNMAQTPPLSSAVPLRCFPAVGDLADAKFAGIPARQRKISPRRGSWTPAVSCKRSTMRTDVMAFPWRCRRPPMRALTM